MPSKLPHLSQEANRPLADIVSAIGAGGSTDECYLAVSKGFWEPGDQQAFDVVFSAYKRFFADLVVETSQLVDAPVFQGSWDAPEFPEWAHGYEVAVWAKFWLRLEHEDRECPIIIALSPVPA